MSIIELVGDYGFLSNLLCGLALGAVAFLLGKSEAAPPHTIALLSSGVLILTADSFLFASVHSRRPFTVDGLVAPGGENVCYLMWTLAMPGFGMLMIGATVLVVSIGWMIVQYAILNDIESRVFATLGGVFSFFIVLTTALSLVNISNQYLVFMTYPDRPSALAVAAVWIFGAAMAVIACSMIVVRTLGLYRYRRHHSDWGAIADSRFGALAVAAVAISAYGFLAITVDALVFLFRADDSVRGAGVMWSAVVLCLVVPWVVYLPICYAVPGPGFKDAVSSSRGPR
ncbi:hypothetical protein [Mycobacterium sp. IS-1496]|uniref:hypothetical protein n=1 Tax=Mycobacterium sp. IS-1496 TaxID=1772284 RepID=UPI002570F721|nr:hypothetical protein [Mycobacterium sp. IS-1496]